MVLLWNAIDLLHESAFPDRLPSAKAGILAYLPHMLFLRPGFMPYRQQAQWTERLLLRMNLNKISKVHTVSPWTYQKLLS